MPEVRVDKWLWAVRIFKTRSLATDACKLGRVSLNGASAKASRMLKVGDVVSVRKSPITYSFKVLGMPSSRVGAKLVPEYMENVTTADQYAILEMKRVGGFIDRAKGLGRPTKKERRDIDEFQESLPSGVDFFDWGEDWDDSPEEALD